MEKFNDRLRHFRIQAGLSQKQAAEKLKIPASTYRDWEYGKQIKGEPYIAIAAAFGTTVSELLTDQRSAASELQRALREMEQIVEKMRRTVAAL